MAGSEREQERERESAWGSATLSQQPVKANVAQSRQHMQGVLNSPNNNKIKMTT